MRLASVELLEDYAASASIKLQVYRSRVVDIKPPTAFVDSMGEVLDHSTNLTKLLPTADIFLLHGLYDHGTAVDQRDAFMDGFRDWVEARFHAAGANTMLAMSGFEDIPSYSPEWLDTNLLYYATRITLVGYALPGS